MKKILYLLAYVWALLLSGCSSSDAPLEVNGNTGQLELTWDVDDIGVNAGYHTLHISGISAEAKYCLSLDADWMRLDADTLGADGYVDVWVDENEDSQGRTAQLVVTDSEDAQKRCDIKLYQKGLSDNDANADDSDPLSDFRIGWGMNAFLEYQNSNSIKAKVFDLSKLAALDSEDGFQSVQEVVRAKADFSIDCAYSEKEMSSILTKKMDKTSSFFGVKKTISRFSQVSKISKSNRLYVYARMSKTVATKSIDRGVVLYLVENVPTANLPFSSDFKNIYDAIISSSGNERTKSIDKMLTTFGTHVVIESNVGGMVDYVATLDRNNTQQLEVVAEEQSKRVFGKTSSSSSSLQTSSFSYNANAEGAIQIKGGDKQCRKKLQNSINNLGSADVIPNDLLQEWYSSINYRVGNKNSIDLVDFKLLPIWSLFKDSDISQQVMQQVLAMQERSNNYFSDQELGTDCYAISLNNADFNFSNSSNSENSLVKVMYKEKEPILEICEEYVPKIRSDKRIKVFYPIKNGKTNLSKGIFPGDGEGNRPSFLSFSDNDVYVSPIDEYGSNDQLSMIYYIHGNLYEKEYGSSTQKLSNMVVKDHRLVLTSPLGNFSYPVAKIGTGYWTRKYITCEMQFGKYTTNGQTFRIYETIDDGILFANIYGTNDPDFLSTNKDDYGQDVDNETDKQSLWYLPLARDRKNLTDYVGNNLKCLFKGQQSGFDAQFEGYYGPYDDNGNFLGANERRYKNQKCYIPFKSTGTSSDGEALVLMPNYQWHSIKTKSSFTYYPVKLFRTSSFQYQ